MDPVPSCPDVTSCALTVGCSRIPSNSNHVRQSREIWRGVLGKGTILHKSTLCSWETQISFGIQLYHQIGQSNRDLQTKHEFELSSAFCTWCSLQVRRVCAVVLEHVNKGSFQV